MIKFDFSDEIRARLLIGILILSLLYLVNQYNVILFQTISEIFLVVICIGIFFVTWNSKIFIKNNFFLFLGISLFFVGVIHITHIILYSSISAPLLLKNPNVHEQVRLVSWYFLGASFLSSFYFINKKIETYVIIPILGGITFIVLFLIYNGIFPVCYTSKHTLTSFDETSNYIISAIFLISILLLYRKKRFFDTAIFKFLLISIILFMITVPIFSFQKDIPEIFIFLAFSITILAFYILYKGMIETTLTNPYSMLFKEIKESHDDIENLNKQLQQNIRDLEIINQDLESFNWTISHDLKTPFNIISAFASNIIKNCEGIIPEKTIKHIGIIRDESEKGRNLIENLLHFFTSSLKKLEIQNISIEKIVRDVFEQLKISNPDRNIILNIKPAPDAKGDNSTIKEVIYNLILNAIKFTKKREIAIIEFGGYKKDNDNCFYVKDNGIGFNMEYATKIFNVLEKVHDKKEYDGSGIGLAIVNKIIKKHGGTVWAESKENEGSTFYFTLPV
ncbi:MAG: ATP-binding protein [Candidatus Omnitrophica bacterium]|nr:ATP-binding protein [Candidatus Omnitrophota bacterium]